LSSFFGVKLKNKNEKEIKFMILGKWNEKVVKNSLLTIYVNDFLLNDSVNLMIISRNLKNEILPDTVSYKVHYQIKNDSVIFNLGGAEKPYYEGHKIVYLSKNRMHLQFKKSISKYKRIK